MKKYLYFITFVATLGGFLFGFDTAVISGAEQSIQQIWMLNEIQHGLTVSIALIGTVLGALFGGWPSDRFGRKKTLFWIAVLYFISALGSALATSWPLFLFFRFIGGLGVGASSVAAPMYISEVSPANRRGRLVALFQFNIVFGILIAYLSNYFFQGSGENAWRWMLGVEGIPAFIFLSLVPFIPRSPRWLIVKRGKIDEAREIFRKLEPEDYEVEVQRVIKTHQMHDRLARKDRFFQRRYTFPIMLAVLFAMFNQLSGINAIIYYAPRIFQNAGLEAGSALLSTAGVGLINFVFTIIAINLIDRFGRRFLMIIGSVGLIITLGMTSTAFFFNIGGDIVAVSLFVYIAFFGFSQGTVIWVFISEIFPNEVRANGQALGSFTHWIMAAIVAFSVPSAEKIGFGPTFLFFSLMMVLQLIFVLRMMPETKGVSLEELEEKILKR
jgi:MFS transporter, SP family, arabinose:H+ symporter